MLIADSDIVELNNKPVGCVLESDLVNTLRRYNLRDGLIVLSQASNYICHSQEIGHREPQTGVMITQFSLAYIANILLISGANDYKKKKLSDKNNWLALCNIYGNNLIQPELAQDYNGMNYDQFRSLMIRMYFEQMVDYQFAVLPLISRTIIMFNEIVDAVTPNKFEPLSKIFINNTGLDIYEYLKLAMSVYAVSRKSRKTVTFNLQTLINSEIPQFKSVLTKTKVDNFIEILVANYEKFKIADKKNNQNLDPKLTKNRFNPLFVYPIIETDVKNQGDFYIIPNIVTYAKKAFGGIYWWFHLYFESNGRQKDFHTYFGSIFQEYVGIILKGIYGSNNVYPEFKYPNGMFIDWWVKKDNKIYLFEVKANQFNLQSRQTGDKEVIIRNEIKKIADAIEQVYKNIQDIEKYIELKEFRVKKIIPIIVFMDILFVSSSMLKPWIDDELKKRESEKTLKGLSSFNFNLINIEELEFFESAVDKIEIENIFEQLKSEGQENFFSQKNFLTIVKDVAGNQLRNKLLDKKYYEFGKDIGLLPKYIENQMKSPRRSPLVQTKSKK